jgi:2-polyprenyl-6-hydroxyphenyl methylase/3-demethylubiquinone-9 3-methyltransferase
MTMQSTADNVDPAEVAKFAALAQSWWDPKGPSRPLHELNPLRLRYVERLVALAGRAVCDVGCGGGILAESMARSGAQVLGIDRARAVLDVATLHALEAGIAVEYREIAAETLAEERPAAFDLVTCMEMLEHVPDPAASLAALAQLVKPGGDVIVSTLNRNARAFAVAIVGAEYIARVLPRGTHAKPASTSRI